MKSKTRKIAIVAFLAAMLVSTSGLGVAKLSDAVPTLAETNAVAENATTVTTEAGLSEALATGGKVVLGADIKVTEEIAVPAGVTATLDLAGNAITSGLQTDTTKHIYPINNYGTLTIEDSVGTGSITGRGIYNGTDGAENTGVKLTVNGAKIVAQDWNGGACIWGYGGEVYLNNATLIGYTGCVYSKDYLEINGGTYTCYSGIADDGTQVTAPTYNIRAYNGLKITDGTFTSRHGVISLGGGEGVIEGGSYTIIFTAATTSNVVYTYGGADLTINGGEFISDNTSGKADSGAAVLVSGADATVEINDGTFVGMNGMVSINDNTVINGGSYDTVWDYNDYGKIEEAVSENAVIEVAGDIMVKTESGLVTEVGYVAKIGDATYKTLAEAVAAANAGDTVVLYQSVDDVPTINKAITIKGVYNSVAINKAIAENFPDVDGTVTFENLTFNDRISTENASNDQSKMTLKFVNCVFNVSANTYAIQGGSTASTPGNDVLGGLVIEGCTFNATAESNNYMVYAQCVNNLVITDCVFNGGDETKGAIHTGDSTEYATVATISGNTISGVARGVQVGNSVENSSVAISENTFTNVTTAADSKSGAIYIHGNATEAVAVTVTENTAKDCSTLLYNDNNTTDGDSITAIISTFTGNTVNDEEVVMKQDGSVGVYTITEVATYDELVAALATTVDEVKLTADITTTSAIVTSGVTSTINLNGKTLTIGAGDNKFNDASNITIKNGNVCITGVTVSGNAIFCLDEYEETLKTVLTLENVNLTGNGYSSAYGIFYIGDSSELNVIGGEWDLANDTYAAGGVFKADDAKATLNVSGTTMKLHNVRRVVTYATTVIEDSTMTITGDADGVDVEMEHGFNRSPLTIIDSTITMTDMVGRGITAECGAVKIEGDSAITMTNVQEATIDVRSSQTVTVAETATVVLDKEPTIAEGSAINGTVMVVAVKIGDTVYETLAEALTAANQMTGDVTIEIYNKVEYTDSTPDLTGAYDSITFVGKTESAEISITRNGSNGYISGQGNDAKVAFEDLILSKSAGYFAGDAGFMNVAFSVYRVGEVFYTECSFPNGACAAGPDTTYTNCTFGKSYDKYALWAYGADVTVDTCVFDCDRGIKMYAEGAAKTTAVVVTNSDFSKLTGKPAIVLTYGESVTLKGNTYSSTTGVFELDLDGAPNGTTVTADDLKNLTCKNDNGACGVLVDGKIYTTVAQAAAVATEGSTVTLLHDSAETVVLAKGVTLDKNGYTADNVTVKVDPSISTNQITLDDGGKTYITFSLFDLNATKNVYIKLYDANETLLATTTLQKPEYFTNAELSAKFCIVGESSSWKTLWEEDKLRADYVPAKMVLYVDEVEVDSADFKLITTGGEAAVEWADVPGVAALVAEVNGTYYTTLAKALAAAQTGETITLLADVDVTETIEISGKTLTLDLGTYTISDKSTNVLTSNDDVWGLIELTNGAKLTVCGNGTIECNYTNVAGGWTGMAYAIDVDSTSELTVNGGTFINGNGGIQTRGKVTVNDGTFISHNGGTCIMAVDSAAKVTVNGGTFKDYVEESDVYTGSGAVWSGFGATVEINGGTYDFAPDPEHDNIVWTLFPAQHAIEGNSSYDTNMTVSGGTFYNFNPETDVVVDYSASQGFTFGSVVAEDFIVNDNGDGTYGVKKFITNKAYVAQDTHVSGWVTVWGQISINGTASFHIEIYSGETYLGKTSLVDTEKVLLDGIDHEVTWHAFIDGSDSWWNTEWEVKPICNLAPTNVKYYVDDQLIGAGEVKMSSADDLNAVVWAELRGVYSAAKIGETYYATLEAALAAVGAGDVVIELLGDVTHDYNAREAYGTAETTSLTINGNGYTLTLNQKDSDWSSLGLANANAKFVINNVIIEKTGHGDTSGAWNTHAIIFTSNVEMTNVTVNNSMAVEAGATLNNVTINEANGYYGLWIDGNGQTVNVNGGAINATNGGRGIKIADEYVATPASVTLNVDGMVFNTAKKAAVLVTSTGGAAITAANVDITNVAADPTNFAWVDEDRAAYYNQVTVNNVPAAQENLESFVVSLESGDAVVGYYKSLQAAIDAAKAGETVTLLADVADADAISIKSGVTLDGNGKTISGNSSVYVAASGVTVIKNVNFKDIHNSDDKLSAIYATSLTSEANVTITGCTFENIDYEAIQLTSKNDVVPTVVITNNIFKADTDTTVKQKRHIHIELGSSTRSGINLTIQENKFYGDMVSMGMWYLDPATTVDNVSKNYVEYPNRISVSYNSAESGTYNGFEVALPLYDETLTEEVAFGAMVVYDKNDADLFVTFEDALAAASQYSEYNPTVKLLADVELTASIKITSTLIFDLNGKQLVGPDVPATSSYYAFIVDGGNLTLKDSVGTGEIWAKCYGVETKSGSFTMESGTITATKNSTVGSAVVNYGGTVIINGGTVSAAANAVYTGGYFANASTTIYAGTVNGPVVVEDWASKEFTETVASASNTYDVLEGYKWVEQDGVYVLTECTYVAEVNGVKYETLADAVEEAEAGDTVTLLMDAKQVDGISITDKNITIDLNGKTFTVTEGSSTYSRNFMINGTSVVTIKNGTLVAAGDYSSGAYGTIRTEGSANVTLTGLKLYNYRGNGLNVKAYAGTTVTISDTEIYSEYGGGIEAAGGTIELTNVIVEQKGMYIKPYNSMAISVNGGGKVTVHSGTYTTECLEAEDANNQGSSHGPWVVGVLNSGGTLIINGGTFTNDNYGDNNLATAARGAVLADTGANIEINGGTFNALKGIIDIQNNLGDASKNPTGTITGGVFSADPTNDYVKVADGYIVVKQTDGYMVGVLPNAEVNNLGAIIVEDYDIYNGSLTEGGDPIKLQIAMEFIAKDTPEEAEANAFGNYTTDFYITIDGLANDSFVADGCYLAGEYGSFGWIMIPLDGMTIEDGEVYPVISSVGLDFKYVDICTSVQVFNCGIYFSDAVLAANPDLTVKLQLGLSENIEAAKKAEFITVNKPYEYNVEDLTKERFYGASLTLGTDLTVHYYVNMTDEEAEKAVMNFEFEGLATSTTAVYDNGYKMWKFSFEHIAPQQMGDIIKSTLVIDDEEVTHYYSVKEYVYKALTIEQTVLGYSDAKYKAFQTALVDTLNYGAAAQIYDDYKTAELVNAGLEAEQQALGSTYQPLTDKDDDLVVTNNGANGVSVKTVNLYYKTANALRIYFVADNMADVSVTVDGEQVEIRQDSKGYYAQTKDIYAHEFSEIHKFVFAVVGSEETVQVEYSVKSQVFYMQDKEGEKELATALWNYGEAVIAYRETK